MIVVLASLECYSTKVFIVSRIQQVISEPSQTELNCKQIQIKTILPLQLHSRRYVRVPIYLQQERPLNNTVAILNKVSRTTSESIVIFKRIMSQRVVAPGLIILNYQRTEFPDTVSPFLILPNLYQLGPYSCRRRFKRIPHVNTGPGHIA